ncbi:hypothetical protein W97_06450 [Coniosporium apollinis CBS 100218]|uniref:Glycosyl transferase n=1 Tax=Coniosporium apollinis (strain CBS 100218) TaxID=1168221 RepID=R7YZ69_CONA1|nr:uncharacterized protein W97_06450 [Coniosporium apollinis CBS 100218]EON67197.1 hypothetical protein W97_06450 [Coniosporium apollinis CBS 100218]
MAEILAIEASGGNDLLENWWQFILLAIIAVSVFVGVVALVWTLYNFLRKRRQISSATPSLSKRVKAHLDTLSKKSVPLGRSGGPRSKPSSFGVYLGSVEYPPTNAQARLFEHYDVLVLDSQQCYAVEALSMAGSTKQLLGRISLEQLLDTDCSSNDARVIQSIDKIVGAVYERFISRDRRSIFQGVLIGDWENRISVIVVDAVARYLALLGLEVSLEVSPPNFLDQDDMPDLQLYSGVVVKNASILPNGERRDFFQLEKMKPTVKAFVSQACLRPFAVLMWETIDDNVVLSHAVVKRSYNWTEFHGAVSWIGTVSALTDATLNAPMLQPLGAFDWLKEGKIMKLHETYRSTRLLAPWPKPRIDEYRELEGILPSIRSLVESLLNHSSSASSLSSTLDGVSHEEDRLDTLNTQVSMEWAGQLERFSVNPLSISPTGITYEALGCFPIGFDVTSDDFNKIVDSQRRLRRLNLLSTVSQPDVRQIGVSLRDVLGCVSVSEVSARVRQATQQLSDLLLRASYSKESDPLVRVYLGLDSGFHTSSGVQFWGVWETDERTGALILYLSKNARDLSGTVLHTYLSSQGLPRHQCFEAEVMLASHLPGDRESMEKGGLPERLAQDLGMLSPADMLLLLQHLHFSRWDETRSDPLLHSIQSACEDVLLDVPSFLQLKQRGNIDYLSGNISDAELIEARLTWYQQHGWAHLPKDTALTVFRDVHCLLLNILQGRRYDQLNLLTSTLESLLTRGTLDTYADILAFSLFCAARKAAFDEVYLEVTDRNPLFNEFSDQAAAFAELFALGSRCDAYFDVTPSAFGRLLADRYRAYYGQPDHQPPLQIGNAPAVSSAYAAAQTDIDPHEKSSAMPAYKRFTFLSVFAIPALVDILLLTTTGRGLYLSAFMSMREQEYATLALMLSLLLSGAIGTWISIGGTYYLISMAFSAAEMFVLTRLIGGLGFTIAGGIIGFIIISAVTHVQAGAIFFFYLVGFTSYLSLLAVLATYQFPGSSFGNGRVVIICLIPLLGISPILTTWVNGYDSIIYLSVLFFFVFALLLGTRRVAARWVTWLQHVSTTSDAEISKWYSSTASPDAVAALKDLSGPAALKVARERLSEEVFAERDRRLWSKATEDPLVKKLAECWDATVFLLDWYSRISDIKKPIPYSSTWNLQVGVAKDSLLQQQKGVRLHNAFILWRNAGDEIGCGILYFLVALLDRWIELLYGEPLLFLSAATNKQFRVAVGFGLAYYLIGAVLLDYKAGHLHQQAQTSVPVSISSTKLLRKAVVNDAKFKRILYWKTLARFVGVHVWALALSAGLIWALDGTKISLIMFLAYVGAYTGLLLYQYNHIFSGPRALGPLLCAAAIALPLGLILKRVNSQWPYNGVVALAVATWIAALTSLYTARIGLPGKAKAAPAGPTKDFRAYHGVSVDQKWSQAELEAFHEGLLSVPREERFIVDAQNHPGTEIRAILLSCHPDSLSNLALAAYPNAPHLVRKVVAAWEQGAIAVELTSMRSVVKPEADVRALTCYTEGRLHLFIASDSDETTSRDSTGSDIQMNITSNCRAIAETLLRATAESLFGLSHTQASIAESLLVCRTNEDWRAYQVSESLKRAIPFEFSESKMAAFASAHRRDLLENLCLGLECETKWECLPQNIRTVLLRRCLGEPSLLSATDLQWLQTHLHAEIGCSLETRIARYDLGAYLAVQKSNYFKAQGPLVLGEKAYQQRTADVHYYQDRKRATVSTTSALRAIGMRIKAPFSWCFHALGTWTKFIMIAPVADLEYQRELRCTIKQSSFAKFPIVAKIVTWLLNDLWIFAKISQRLGFPFFIYHRRKDVKQLSESIKGTLISLKNGRLIVQSIDNTSTAFIRSGAGGTFELYFYSGAHKTEPEGEQGLVSVSRFSKDMRLKSRVEFSNGTLTNGYAYEYPSVKSKRQSKLMRIENKRIPISRRCIRGPDKSSEVIYNHKGHIESGSYVKDGNLVRFRYYYRKNARFEDELLRGDFAMDFMTVNVEWCAPPVRHPEKSERWVPGSRVTKATFVQGSDVWECSWTYDHQFHPTIVSKLNDEIVETPDMIRHDWLGVLKKPNHCSFLGENPLLNFPSVNLGLFSWLFRHTQRIPVSTATARTKLWKEWKRRNDLDGVVIRWLDEKLLRAEPLLKPYWQRRDRGNLTAAEDYLAMHADTISASSELAPEIAAWTPLALRLSDLFSFGQGGDANVNRRTKTLQPDTDSTLHVVAVDSGTWPNEGGGVSACRRDLVNNLRTIRWHMVVESANDFGLPKHQTEENVESLKVVPLWGLDFLHPVHGIFSNKLDSEIDKMTKGAAIEDVKRNFIPTLTALVRGARAINLTQADVKQATRALVNLNTYFQDSRHWKEVWTSDIVKDTWRHLWIDDMPNATPISDWLETYCPTLSDLETSLDLWFRYLFIFSIPIPEEIPAVFQASHHSPSASYGIVCKIKRNCTLQIWDHAISWRETNLYLSSALCTLPSFTRNALLGLMRLTSMLTLHHADQILPCADQFNPGWEVEVGTSQGAITHRNTFRRKVDPVVNGIPPADLKKFSPVTEIKTKKPTVTMLSHVWFAKDIKTALLAADVILNKWGFDEYQLDIYGALNKAPIYSSECTEVIATKALQSNVSLCGTADPGVVLSNTWLFLNSSVSEGLPLALGEAALTGAPVVATDVGASLRVLTDPKTNERYSAIVAPNDAVALARAQINLLAMLDEWAPYAEDEPGQPVPVLPVNPTREDVKRITKRMYEKTPQRRKLGMMARDIVQRSFSGERYLREHEQMLWVGKARNEMLGLRPRQTRKLSTIEMATGDTTGIVDEQLEKMAHPRPQWWKHSSMQSSFSSVWEEPMAARGLLGGESSTTPSFDTDVEATGSAGSSFAGSSGSSVKKPNPVARSQYLQVPMPTADGRLSVMSGKTKRKSGLSYMTLAHEQDSDGQSDSGPITP